MGISLTTILAVTGLILGMVEILALGFGTVFLMFIALGCLTTSLLMYMGILQESVLIALTSVALTSSVYTAALWKPLKRLQTRQQDPEEQPNVFSGLKFNLADDLVPGASFEYRYSGVSWTVSKMTEDNEIWPRGTEVEVLKTGVGKMWVGVVARS